MSSITGPSSASAAPPASGAPPALSIVIVSWNVRELLAGCLASLERDGVPGWAETFVVDNASPDGTVAMVTERFPWARMIASPTNLGFSRGNNLAVPRCTGSAILFLNPDTRVTEGALDRLLDLMEEHREIGISGCRLQLDDGGFDHASKRSFPTPLSALGHFTGVGRRREKGILAAYRAPEIEAGRVAAESFELAEALALHLHR